MTHMAHMRGLYSNTLHNDLDRASAEQLEPELHSHHCTAPQLKPEKMIWRPTGLRRTMDALQDASADFSYELQPVKLSSVY